MSAPAIDPELVRAMKDLRLGKLLDTLAERLALAKNDATPIDVDTMSRSRPIASSSALRRATSLLTRSRPIAQASRPPTVTTARATWSASRSAR